MYLDVYLIFGFEMLFKAGLIVLPALTSQRWLTPCFGTIFCYVVYAVSIVLPGAGLSVMVNCSQIIRDELVHQTECLRMLGTMLAGPRKWEWLPKLRYDKYSDMLAWAEMYEYLEETPAHTFPFVLGVVGTTLLFVYCAALLVIVFLMTLQGSSSDHLPVVALAVWVFPFGTGYLLIVSIAGIRVNAQRKKLMRQLGLLVLSQRKFYAHIQSKLESSNVTTVTTDDVPDLKEQGGLLNFKHIMEFTSNCVYRWETGSYGSSLLGLQMDVKNLCAILTAIGSMMAYVVKNLGPGLEHDFCLLFVDLGFENANCTVPVSK